MSCKEPESMDELLYFTRRTLDNEGRLRAWVLKKTCPKCKKSLMGKPVVKGKIKIRATTYVCPSCQYTEEKADHEKDLEVCVEYTCPACHHHATTNTPYKRKTWKGVPAFVFSCESCEEKIGITKKMKQPKVKK